MATTERVIFKKIDLIQGIEWATPIGSVTFKPKDGNYNNYDLSEKREFIMFVNGEIEEIGNAKWLIEMVNHEIKKVLKNEK